MDLNATGENFSGVRSSPTKACNEAWRVSTILATKIITINMRTKKVLEGRWFSSAVAECITIKGGRGVGAGR